MNKNFIRVLACLLLASATYTCKAQVLTKYGDNVATLDGIIKAYYDVVSVKKGQKVNYERDSLLHMPNVKVGSAGVGAHGESVMYLTSLKEYHRMSDAFMEKDGYNEHEVARKVERARNLYHVWSTYETRNQVGGKIIGQGVNSIDLYFDGKRFWILGWFYD